MRTKCETQNCRGRLTLHLAASRRVCEFLHRYVLCVGACGCVNAVYDIRSLGKDVPKVSEHSKTNREDKGSVKQNGVKK